MIAKKNNYTDLKQHACPKMMNKKKVQNIHTVHVGWTTEIIYVNKAGHAYITCHTGLGGKHNHLCSFK